MIRITPAIAIDAREIEEQFIRASGPGGQNVNKVATAVQLRFNIENSPALTDAVRVRLKQLAGRRLNSRGELIIEARRYRTQAKNREDAIERLIALIRQAAEPRKPRKKNRPTAAAKKRRLDGKRRRGEIKRLRFPVPRAEN